MKIGKLLEKLRRIPEHAEGYPLASVHRSSLKKNPSREADSTV
jgi:hypothetical protein